MLNGDLGSVAGPGSAEFEEGVHGRPRRRRICRFWFLLMCLATNLSSTLSASAIEIYSM